MSRETRDLGTWGKISTQQQWRVGSSWGSDSAGATATRWRARVRVRDLDGVTRPVEKVGPTERQAYQRLVAHLQVRNAPSRGPISHKTTMRELMTRWVDALDDRELAPQTVDSYRRMATTHVDRFMGGLMMSDIRPDVLESIFRQVRREKGASVEKLFTTVVTQALHLPVRSQLWTANPARSVEKVRSQHRTARRALTESEERRLREFLDSDAQAQGYGTADLLLFMLATGVRISEAGALRWSRVDLDRGLVTIDATLTRVDGQGIVLQEWDKTRVGRTLMLPAWAVEMLRTHRETHREDKDGQGVVFTSPDGHLIDRSNVSKQIRRIFDACGIPPEVTPHGLRKRVATKLYSATHDIVKVSRQLGHARPSMTLDYYVSRDVPDTGAVDAL